VLHHPKKREVSQDAKPEADHRRPRRWDKKLRRGEHTENPQHITFHLSEVA
jgi:hypothetical protein